jgi:hypothetical protein
MVLDAENMHIQFHSAGIAEVLSVPTLHQTPWIGRDIFKVIGDIAISPPRNFKADIRKPLSAGHAISATLRLPAPRATVNQPPSETTVVTHWTPLKNERAEVCYVVLTLGT